jgi:hypothetical protein
MLCTSAANGACASSGSTSGSWSVASRLANWLSTSAAGKKCPDRAARHGHRQRQLQVHEGQAGQRHPQLLAMPPAQQRSRGHHGPGRCGHGAGQTGQPGPAVALVQGPPGRHARAGRCAVQRIAFDETPAALRGPGLRQAALAAAGHAHHDDHGPRRALENHDENVITPPPR